MTDMICVGAIAGAFGVKGELRLKSFCADAEAIFTYGPLFSEDGTQRYELRPSRPVTGGIGARIKGVASKEAADALKGVTLWAPREALPSLPDDEFYYADLIGLDAYDTQGALLGRVKAVHNHGAGDIVEVTGPMLKTSLLLPFTRACVPTVDLKAARIVVDPPEDLA